MTNQKKKISLRWLPCKTFHPEMLTMPLQLPFLIFKPLKSKLLAFDEAFTCYTFIRKVNAKLKNKKYFCIFMENFEITRGSRYLYISLYLSAYLSIISVSLYRSLYISIAKYLLNHSYHEGHIEYYFYFTEF